MLCPFLAAGPGSLCVSLLGRPMFRYKTTADRMESEETRGCMKSLRIMKSMLKECGSEATCVCRHGTQIHMDVMECITFVKVLAFMFGICTHSPGQILEAKLTSVVNADPVVEDQYGVEYGKAPLCFMITYLQILEFCTTVCA